MTTTLDTALELVEVHAPGVWENDQGPAGWWAVSDESGIIAYFCDERLAFQFRLNRINEMLNGVAPHEA